MTRRVLLPVPILISILIAVAVAQKGGGSAWPHRALMEAPYENSLDARYVSKPVHESLVVDDMETDRPWVVTGMGKMAYTNERAKDGKRALRFQTSLRDEEHLRANRKNGSFTGDQGGFTAMRLNFAAPQDWEVAPGKIAFHHMGYRPTGEKLAFAGRSAGSHFEVVDASSGKSAASFPVRVVSNRRGQFKVVDFSAFTKPKVLPPLRPGKWQAFRDF